MTFYDPEKVLIVDTEAYPNLWSIGFTRLSDGKTLVMEHSHRRQIDTQRILKLMMSNLIVTYNGNNYDMPMIWKAISGATNAELKQANDRIIVGKMKPWHAREVLGIEVPRDCFIRKDGSRTDGLWHCDLAEPQPNAFASLKTLAGRLHAKSMQDLPYSPDTALTDEQMDHVLSYMGNDIDNTQLVFEALHEALSLRETFSRDYGINLMSKSDAQMGEALIKKRVENEINEKVTRVETPSGTTFRFNPPPYLRFKAGSELAKVFDRVCEHDFIVGGDGKVELPGWLSDLKIDSAIIGAGDADGSVYQMGIGGLHSTEKNRAVLADDEFALVDFDVASYYPAIIINSGLYPRALGPKFLDVFRKIRDERVQAKGRLKDPAFAAEKDQYSAKEKGLKIALNGTFGKLGSSYSVLYAPHLMIATTLTGQFALLMLIQAAEEAGISVVSANTDGVVFRIPRDIMGPIIKDRVTEGPVKALIETWEAATGFVMEATPYRGIYNRSVNDYLAVKEDGEAKWKGAIGNPWRTGDLRGQMMKNPQMPIICTAVEELIVNGTPLEDTIYGSRDVRDFVTVVKVDGGATWCDRYLGKVVRYYWSHGGAEILRAKGHKTTGNHGKVPKSDGCRPLMDLPDAFPADVDHEAYVAAAREVLMDIGYDDRPPPVKPLRLFKWSAPAWFAVAV